MLDNINQEARSWAMWCHLSALLAIPLAFVGIPPLLLNLVGPLVVWLWKKDQHSFIDDQGKESLNFQLSLSLYGFSLVIGLGILMVIFVIAAGGAGTAPDGSLGALTVVLGLTLAGLVILAIIVSIIQLVLVIFAAVKAYKGQFYRYPLTIRFLR
jgi:uncharacterized protein